MQPRGRKHRAHTHPPGAPPARAVQWSRPEDRAGANPVYTVSDDRPGADIAGATAAALAAGSVIFKDVDKAYSEALLAGALKAYAHAVKHAGALYNAAIPDGGKFYPSTNAYDDMAWAAVWLVRARALYVTPPACGKRAACSAAALQPRWPRVRRRRALSSCWSAPPTLTHARRNPAPARPGRPHGG